MVAPINGDWKPFGLRSGKDGWISEDPQAIETLVEKGSLGSASFRFALRNDAKSVQVWVTWGICLMALVFGAMRREALTFGIGLVLSARYLFAFSSMVAMWKRGGAKTGVATGHEPHRLKEFAALLIDGQTLRVAMKAQVASEAFSRFVRFEVLYIEENGSAFELAFRPVRGPTL